MLLHYLLVTKIRSSVGKQYFWIGNTDVTCSNFHIYKVKNKSIYIRMTQWVVWCDFNTSNWMKRITEQKFG